MAVSVYFIAEVVERVAPKAWAETWDNVGILIGDGAAKVQRILLALDPSPEVVQEAIDYGAELIVGHHPLLFRPLKNLRTDNRQAEIPLRLIQHGIAYYAAHTNLDQSRFSSSWTLGEALGLQTMDIMDPIGGEELTGNARGYGVIGLLPEAESLERVWGRLAARLSPSVSSSLHEGSLFASSHDLSSVRFAGDRSKPIRKVAIANGSGGSFIPKALARGADLMLTGDVDHHQVLDALQGGMAVCDMGHFLSEAPMLKTLADYFKEEKALRDVEIMVSRTSLPWRVRA